MASIDERVVSMAFENQVFEQRVSVTMSTLTKLDVAIKNIGHTNGLSNIEADANKVKLTGLASVLDKIKSKINFTREASRAFSDVESASNKVHMSGVNNAIDKTAGHFSVISQAAARVDISSLGRGVGSVINQFSILEGAAAVALGSIASKALMAGGQMVKSLSFGPLSAGFSEYETNLNAVQTTLANTQAAGTSLKDVNHTLGVLNEYSDKTIYNFGEMAKNIGTFTAAGVGLDEAAESIKGISNLAAMSGSNSQQASMAMYQLSQAIAAGKVNLQDWNSVTNAGMGGKVFQKALFDTGKAMGTITNSPVGETFEEWEKKGNNFRQSLSATQKAAKDGTAALAKAQKEGAKSVKDAQEGAAESVANAAERVQEAQKSAGEAVAEAAIRVRDTQEQAAESTKAAAEKVVEAQNGVKDAAKKATADIKAAVDAQKQQTKESAADVEAALDSVVEARKRLVEAMKPPSADELQAAADALTTAQLDQADLSGAITEAQKEQKRSAEDLAAAQLKLKELQKAGASASDILAATRAVEDAQTRATDASDAVTRATLRQNAATRDLHDAETSLAEVKNKGTDADANVKDARDALTKATDDYKDAQVKARKDIVAAEQNVRDVRKQSAKDQKQAGEDLAQAEKDQSKVQIKAREDVAKAEKDQADTIIKSRDDVAKAEKDQAKAIKDSREQVADAEEAAAERIKSARTSMTGEDQGPPSWLTSEVLTKTLSQFTGDMTKAQLKAQGFTDAQAEAILKVGETAKKSATEVKTISQLWGVMKESIATGWADTFRIIFGDFGEAKKLFTSLSQYLGKFTEGFADSRNKLLEQWKDLGGRKELINGIKNAFKGLLSIIAPIKAAFRDIFPAATAKDLFELTKKFADLMAQLKIGPETSENLRRTFRGLFALFSIGKTIVGEILGVFFDLIGVVGKGSGGFLEFTGTIGDFLVALNESITKGKSLHGVFDTISEALKVPLEGLRIVANYIKSIFGFGDDKGGTDIAAQFDQLGKSSEGLRNFIEKLKGVWDGFMRIMRTVHEFLKPFIDAIGVMLDELRQKVVDSLEFLTSEKGLNIAQTGLLAGIFAAVRKGLASINIGLPTDTLDKLNKSLGALTGALSGLQAQVHAATIATIAVAIALLAGSIVLLSKVDSAALTRSLTAIAVGLGELGAAMVILSKFATGSVKMGPMAAGMVILAAAMVILAIAIRMLSGLSWEELAKGLSGIGGGLLAMGVAMKFMTPWITTMAPGILVVAFAMNLMAAAVTQFATLSWEELAKGILAVGGALVAMGVGLWFMSPLVTTMAPGILAISVGFMFLSRAIATMGKLSWESLAKGILGVGFALVAIGIGMSAMPLTLLPTAAGLVVVAIALQGVALAVALFGNMNLGTLIKGVIGMGAALVVLAIGLNAMIGTLPGAAALLAAGAAFALLVPAIALLGSLPILVIVKGLIAIAATLGVLALVGAVAAVPLAALGASLTTLGIAMVLIAASIFIFAGAMRLLSVVGAKGLVALGAIIVGIIALIPKLVKDFLIALVEVLEAIVKLLPKIVIAVGLIIDALLAIIIEAIPKIAIAISALIVGILKVLNDNAQPMIEAGWKLILNLLQGFEQNLPKAQASFTKIVNTFLNQLAADAPKILESGANMVNKFLEGLQKQLPKVIENAAKVVVVFLGEITRRLPTVIEKGQKLVLTFLYELTKRVPRFAKAGADFLVAVINGIGSMSERVLKAGVRVAVKLMNGLASAGGDLIDAGFKAIIKLLNGIEKAIRQNSKQMRDAGWGIADAIIDGMLDGFKELWTKVENLAKSLADKLPGPFKKALKILSPSRVFMEIGELTMEGLAIGLASGGAKANTVVGDVASDVVSTTEDEFGKVPSILDGILDMDPTITPVLDLSEVEKGARKMGDLTTPPVVATVSAAQASDISATAAQNKADWEDPNMSDTGPVKIEFNQTNTSPESLSDTEIYRQTKNQLGQLKRVLGLPITQYAAR